ncbi:ADP-ribosylglycohydrolase family protein [Candidatus Uabimicrobium sp. HlEnr_7]|uniref:ADP-ribosylglycohydrolase family protein n=1 Tax=Candidatus Uabimicrobium helgolandensis TaxID=3095367 RepID=UPI003557B98A
MEKIQRAHLALEGLSIGDAFGQQFFGQQNAMIEKIEQRILPEEPWHLTDDSIMALGIFETLEKLGGIDQDYLAKCFAQNYKKNVYRGYGGTAHSILRAIYLGGDWREIAPAVFSGSGSYGNGAAMRIAPLGAYFAEDIDTLKKEAQLSCEVTHSHIEGQAGGLAIALACGWVFSRAESCEDSKDMLRFVLDNLSDSETRNGIQKACELPFSYSVATAVSALGNGTMISAQDTVPFSLWCAARHLNNFEEAMWTTVSGLGDRDTTCAIVGGIVALSVGEKGIPKHWQQARESLVKWQECESEWF